MALSRNPVITTFEDETGSWVPVHIDLAQKADVLAIVPASANTMACIAQGFAPNALTSLYLANRAPVLIFPAMNGDMWTHPATQQNAAILAARDNHRIIGPESCGMLACGAEGQGRLVSVDVIVEEITRTLSEK